MIQELLAKLPSIQQDMIQYRLEGYEIDEIAEKTKRSKRSVERILQNFRDQLKALLQSESP
jgi:DNA-directed RNA polymerase specialized sigma24 family protein